ncbi:HAMP domain-containing protein [candidate division KSB1 bacterium]|nr:HAMP domain-containing protein [candidate division KSB1 bacterium]
MDFLFSKIQNKLIAAFILVLLLPFLMVGYYSYQSTTNALIEAEVSKQQEENKVRVNEIESFLDELFDLVLSLSKDESIDVLLAARTSGNPDGIEIALSAVTGIFSDVGHRAGFTDKMTLIDENGMELLRIEKKFNKLNAVSKADLKNVGDQYYFKEAMKFDESMIFDSFIDLERENGNILEPHQPHIRYLTPLFFENGKRAGVLSVSVPAPFFLGNVLKKSGEAGSNYLVDNEGFFYYHSNPEKRWGRDLNANMTLKNEMPAIYKEIMFGGQDGAFIRGNQVYTYSLTTPPAHTPRAWWLIAERPLDVVTAPVRQFTFIFLILAGLALLGGIIMAIIIARGISMPLLHLSQVAEQISQGDLQAEINVKSNDEIGQLAESLQRMRVSLEAAIKRLRRRT